MPGKRSFVIRLSGVYFHCPVYLFGDDHARHLVRERHGGEAEPQISSIGDCFCNTVAAAYYEREMRETFNCFSG
jgi:hypothetical protein